MNLTTRQISLLIASMEGSMKRMSPGCPVHNEVNELYTLLTVELMDRVL